MEVKIIATFQEMEISTMTVKTWTEERVAKVELPYNFNEKCLRASIEGNYEEFLEKYENMIKESIGHSWELKNLFYSIVPNGFKTSARTIARFRLSNDLTLVLSNSYGKINGKYDNADMIFVNDEDLKKIS